MLRTTPTPETTGRVRRSGRGMSLVIAQSLILALLVLVVATQIQVIGQLKLSRTEKDYEHALQAAEAGANWGYNLLNNGGSPGMASDLSIQAFRQAVRNGTIAVTRYPPGSEQGYYVGITSTLGDTLTVVSYGWSRGVVRKVKLTAQLLTVTDPISVLALNPSVKSDGTADSTTSNYAWSLSGSSSVVGACGTTGRIDYGRNSKFYDGPINLYGSFARFGSGVAPTVSPSGPNVPTGHVGTGTLANPAVVSSTTVPSIPTADEAANRYSGTTTGVEYFRTHNHNATGLRYLVRNNSTGVVRELRDPTKPYTVMAAGDYYLDTEFIPTSALLTAAGMTSGESFYGLRAYPGHYFFEGVDQTNGENLFLRTYRDSERASLGLSSQPANPNPGMAEEANIRFWIGHRSGGDLPTAFFNDTYMEYTKYSSRFRSYVASSAGVSLSGNNGGSSQFRINLLVYNKTSAGVPYGSITFGSGAYLFGSLIGWQIAMSGGATVEHDSGEGLGGQPTYRLLDWREIE